MVGICAAVALFIGHSQHNNIEAMRTRRRRSKRPRAKKKYCWHKKKLPTVRAAAAAATTAISTKAIVKWSQSATEENSNSEIFLRNEIDRIDFRLKSHISIDCSKMSMEKYFVAKMTPCAHTNMNGVFSFVRSLHLYNEKYTYRGDACRTVSV